MLLLTRRDRSARDAAASPERRNGTGAEGRRVVTSGQRADHALGGGEHRAGLDEVDGGLDLGREVAVGAGALRCRSCAAARRPQRWPATG